MGKSDTSFIRYMSTSILFRQWQVSTLLPQKILDLIAVLRWMWCLMKEYISISGIFLHADTFKILICLSLLSLYLLQLFSHCKILYVTLHSSIHIHLIPYFMPLPPDFLRTSKYKFAWDNTSNTHNLTVILIYICLIKE